MKRRVSRGGGQALVEFALVFPLLVLLLMIAFDFGRAIYAYNAISNAARQGGRTAIVNQTVTAIQTRAAAQATAVGMDPTTTSLACADPSATDCVSVEFRNAALTDLCIPGDPESGTYGCVAVVTVKTTYTPTTPIISQILGGIALTSTTKQPIESTCIGVTCPIP